MNREEIPEGFKKQKVCHDDSSPPFSNFCTFCSASKNCYSEEFRLVKKSEPDTIHINEINEQKQREELARERAIGFGDWLEKKTAMKNKDGEWIVKTTSGFYYNETYTTDKLYSKYEEHLKK